MLLKDIKAPLLKEYVKQNMGFTTPLPGTRLHSLEYGISKVNSLVHVYLYIPIQRSNLALNKETTIMTHQDFCKMILKEDAP